MDFDSHDLHKFPGCSDSLDSDLHCQQWYLLQAPLTNLTVKSLPNDFYVESLVNYTIVNPTTAT
jgi:hypothetical protein